MRAGRLGRVVLGLVLLASTAGTKALAQGRDVLAVHPLVFVTPDEERHAKELRSAFSAAIDRYAGKTVPHDQVTAFLDAVPDRSCEAAKDSASCLVQLAQRTKATRSVLIRVSLWPVVISGMLVDTQNRVVMLPPLNVATTDAKRVQAAREALANYVLEHVKTVADEDLTPLVEAPSEPPPPPPEQPGDPQPVVAPPLLTEEPVGTERTARFMRPVGTGLAAVGIAALVTGGVFHFRGVEAATEADELRRASPVLSPAERDRVAELQAREKDSNRWRAVGLGVGVAALGAGTFLLLTAPDASATTTDGTSGMQVAMGPGQVWLTGRF